VRGRSNGQKPLAVQEPDQVFLQVNSPLRARALNEAHCKNFGIMPRRHKAIVKRCLAETDSAGGRGSPAAYGSSPIETSETGVSAVEVVDLARPSRVTSLVEAALGFLDVLQRPGPRALAGCPSSLAEDHLPSPPAKAPDSRLTERAPLEGSRSDRPMFLLRCLGNLSLSPSALVAMLRSRAT